MFAQQKTILTFSYMWKTPHTVIFINDKDPGSQIERFEIINICDTFSTSQKDINIHHKFITELITKN
jgi:hypothetical protein